MELGRAEEAAGGSVAVVGARVVDADADEAVGGAEGPGGTGGVRRLASLGSTTACTSVTDVVVADASVAPEVAWRGSVGSMGSLVSGIRWAICRGCCE